VHEATEETHRIAEQMLAYAGERMARAPVPLGRGLAEAELRRRVGDTITSTGLGAEGALRLFTEVLEPTCVSLDHPRFLSFIPYAPTPSSALFDLVVGVSAIYGGTWLEASGAVYAENQALRWLADLAGFPGGAGGLFVQGGTHGNLSALATARHAARERRGSEPTRWLVAAGDQAHSSVAAVTRVMDVDLVTVPSDADGRMRGDALAATVDAAGDRVFAVVATAGTTNFGIVDRIDEAAVVCAERGLWLHVDGAYGAAGLAAPSVSGLFAGVERADSLIVDPHKWLFAPFDSCALVYREPELARRAHRQTAGYLDPIDTGEWNPCDYGVGLTRRARGLPFWFSLAAHGTRAYTEAVERTLAVARFAAEEVGRRPYLELARPPDLSVVVFRRTGWDGAAYADWSARLLDDGFAFVVPTSHGGETMTRIAVVNPKTTEDDISAILDTMA
jgi:glutamate/tyrosine decarboxylase-like PLP-dependent enzyme